MYVRLKFKSGQRNEETPFHTLSIADEETYRLRCRLFGLEEEEIDTTTIWNTWIIFFLLKAVKSY